MTTARLALPPPTRAALLLDMDGTLLDIAPTPDSVVVPPGLIASLHGLRARLGDAVAVISGRPVEQVDALLDAASYAVSGEHGGATRFAPGAAPTREQLPSVPAGWREQAERFAAAHPGVLLEQKARGFGLHYRAVPALGAKVHDALAALVADSRDFALLQGHKLWEVRPRGVHKGTAVAALMARKPFAGRLPIYIGDDVTDEDAIAVAEAMGGAGLRVADAFTDPAGVRAWLEAAARDADGDFWPER
jgi:trehalose 6-phosphate phosphatase